MSTTTEPRQPRSHQWRLRLDADLWVSQARARRAKIVDPEAIEEALATAPTRPYPGAHTWVYGRDTDGQLVRTRLPASPAGLTGERAAAVAWLSGSPPAHWYRHKLETPEMTR